MVELHEETDIEFLKHFSGDVVNCKHTIGDVSNEIKVSFSRKWVLHRHVCINGPNSNFYLETHSTSNNIYFIRLRNLPRNSVHYTGVWMTL